MDAREKTLPAPPVARKVPTTTELHGTLLHDDYGWLRRKDDPEVIGYAELVKRFFEGHAAMEPTR